MMLNPLRRIVATLAPVDVEALVRDEVLSLYARLDEHGEHPDQDESDEVETTGDC